MSTIHVDAQVSSAELLKAVDQLAPSELESLLARVLTVRARHQAPCLPTSEADLLLQINQGLPSPLQARYSELIVKRRDESLTSEEQAELLRLTSEVENREADRVRALVEFAQLRKTTLSALVTELGIQAPAHE